MISFRRSKGFTLIEVAVALAILSLVLGGALSVVSQYSDERLRLRERTFATQVSWNRLMERYQFAHNWIPAAERSSLQGKGFDEQYGQEWRWQVNIEEAMGQDLFRYEVQSGPAQGKKMTGALAMYLVVGEK
jgi:type II secretion system protein I